MAFVARQSTTAINKCMAAEASGQAAMAAFLSKEEDKQCTMGVSKQGFGKGI